jgi:2-dehydro-3-deoxyphosphogluconate aldolase/(4S)-4-hydroxy-2-oxoglutarate aldolase
MSKKNQATDLLIAQKLLPLYYHHSFDVSIAILKALYEAGVKMVEYTNRGGAALENFRQMKTITETQMPGMMLGIGTIKNKETAIQYMDAGADFIIAPSMNEAVGEAVQSKGLLWIPGCMTPTEIAAAENAGATIVKIFPGNLLGPSYITAIKDLFPELKFVVTGGVEAEAENLRSWFKAGVVGVGMGSKLISKELVEQNDFETLRAATITALGLVQQSQ